MTIDGVFLAAWPFMRRRALDQFWHGAILGILAVLSAFAVHVIWIACTAFINAPATESLFSALMLAGFLALMTFVSGIFILPMLLGVGAVAGALYVPARRAFHRAVRSQAT